MANEAKNVGIVPSAEHTKIDIPPELEARGVTLQSETRDHEELNSAARELGGTAHGESTHLSLVDGKLDPQQFEQPPTKLDPDKTFGASDSSRYGAFTKMLKGLRGKGKREELKRAA